MCQSRVVLSTLRIDVPTPGDLLVVPAAIPTSSHDALTSTHLALCWNDHDAAKYREVRKLVKENACYTCQGSLTWESSGEVEGGNLVRFLKPHG
jgi:hypothetical protein